MTPMQIATDRAMGVEDPQSFLLAFHAGRAAAEQDVDTARVLRSMVADGHTSSAAGFLEGLAAANADAGMPTQPEDPFWRYRLNRLAKAVA